MRSTTALEQRPQLSGPPADVQLTNWPLRDDGLSAWTLVAGLAVVPFLAGYLSSSVIMGLLSFLALAVSMWRMWMPSKFKFGPKGIMHSVLGRQRRISWSTVRRMQIRSRGVLLLTSSKPATVAVFGSIYIRWRNQRDALVSIVEYYLGSRANA